MTTRNSTSLKLARDVYRLTEDELERFDYIYRFRHAMFEDTAGNCGRNCQPPQSYARRRRDFLKVMCNAPDATVTDRTAMEDIPSLARYFAFRVEEIVHMRNEMS